MHYLYKIIYVQGGEYILNGSFVFKCTCKYKYLILLCIIIIIQNNIIL